MTLKGHVLTLRTLPIDMMVSTRAKTRVKTLTPLNPVVYCAIIITYNQVAISQFIVVRISDPLKSNVKALIILTQGGKINYLNIIGIRKYVLGLHNNAINTCTIFKFLDRPKTFKSGFNA